LLQAYSYSNKGPDAERLFSVNKKAVFFKNEEHSFLLIFSKAEYLSFKIIDIMI